MTVGTRRSRTRPSPAHPAPQILNVRYRLKMGGVHAICVSAFVVEYEFHRNGAHKALIRPSVSAPLSVVLGDHSVPTRNTPCPYPAAAIRLRGDIRPKAVDRRD